jgi:acyl-CoA thioester hydrolase
MSQQNLKAKYDFLKSRSIYSFWTSEHVRWSDTDLVGHVNNLAFATYFETGRTNFLEPVMDKNRGDRVLALLARVTVDYLGEIHWPSKIDVGTVVLSIGRSSYRVGQALYCGDQCVGVAESVLVLIDEESRKSRDIPDWLRAWLTTFSSPELGLATGEDPQK